MRQLTGLDTQFLAIESDTTVGHVGGLAIFDPATAPGGTFGIAEVRAMLEERLHMLPPLRWTLVPVPMGLDRPYWKDDQAFDLDFHVRELALPAPGDDEQLSEQVARIASRRLDRARPLWELYVIHGLKGGRVAIQTKMHHAMIDGMSGAEIMGIMFDIEPTGREIPPADANLPAEVAPGTLEMLGRGVASLPLYPVRALRALPNTLPYLDVAPSIFGVPGAEPISRTASRLRRRLLGSDEQDGNVVERPKMRAPRVPFSGKISPHRRFVFGSMPLADVKRVKNHFGVTVNDVVVSLCSGAIRDWLIANDVLPDAPLLAQIPVSVRTTEQMGTYGNRISVMIVPIPTDVEAPEDRLAASHESMRAAKDRHRALPAEALQDVTNFIPPAINARAARVALQLGANSALRPLFNVIISNVPGPPIPLYLAGAKLEANYPVSVITDGAGLNITVLSYLDHVDIGIICDREQMPDVQRVLDGMQSELDALLALCDDQGAD
jgi:diacylglycerol O-acyltransferase / wax synthase